MSTVLEICVCIHLSHTGGQPALLLTTRILNAQAVGRNGLHIEADSSQSCQGPFIACSEIVQIFSQWFAENAR